MWGLMRPDAIAILKDKECRKTFHRYFSILEDEAPAQFLILKKTPASRNIDSGDAQDSLQTILDVKVKDRQETDSTQ
jgi:hypothetical protein